MNSRWKILLWKKKQRTRNVLSGFVVCVEHSRNAEAILQHWRNCSVSIFNKNHSLKNISTLKTDGKVCCDGFNLKLKAWRNSFVDEVVDLAVSDYLQMITSQWIETVSAASGVHRILIIQPYTAFSEFWECAIHIPLRFWLVS